MSIEIYHKLIDFYRKLSNCFEEFIKNNNQSFFWYNISKLIEKKNIDASLSMELVRLTVTSTVSSIAVDCC